MLLIIITPSRSFIHLISSKDNFYLPPLLCLMASKPLFHPGTGILKSEDEEHVIAFH